MVKNSFYKTENYNKKVKKKICTKFYHPEITTDSI